MSVSSVARQSNNDTNSYNPCVGFQERVVRTRRFIGYLKSSLCRSLRSHGVETNQILTSNIFPDIKWRKEMEYLDHTTSLSSRKLYNVRGYAWYHLKCELTCRKLLDLKEGLSTWRISFQRFAGAPMMCWSSISGAEERVMIFCSYKKF